MRWPSNGISDQMMSMRLSYIVYGKGHPEIIFGCNLIDVILSEMNDVDVAQRAKCFNPLVPCLFSFIRHNRQCRRVSASCEFVL